MLTTHEFADRHLDALAEGHGDAGCVEALRAGQLSNRLVKLRALLDVTEIREALRPGFDLLCRAQRDSPSAVAEVLLHPSVGGWLAWCLRRLRRSEEPDPAHLNLVAAAAAIRAGTDFTITAHPANGMVVLPAVGGFPASGPVEIGGTASGPPLVDGREAPPGWRTPHELTAECDGLALRVLLDDLDPYRDCHGLATTGPLDDDAVRRWKDLLEAAWTLLVREHPHYAAAIGAGLRVVVPLRRTRPGRGASATSSDAFGATAMSEPVDAVTLAVGLVHEFQHAKLAALMDLLPLHSADHRERFYAPWRDDPRPLGGLLHGAYAFFGVADFWRRQREVTDTPFAHFEFGRWREQTLNAVRTLRASGELTELGHRFTGRLGDRLEGWADRVPEEPASAARAAIVDHHVSWRLRNLRPDADDVGAIAKAWISGVPCPGIGHEPPALGGPDPVLDDNGRMDLLFMRLREPERFEALAADRTELARLVPTASDSDVAYVRGDDLAAEAGYRRALFERPDRQGAWAGLALVRRRRGRIHDPCVTEPELVMAVSRRIAADRGTPPDPGELADWLVTRWGARCRTAAAASPGPG